MTTTAHSDRKDSTMEIRTYETFKIVWARGSEWSGYQSADEAQAVVEFAGARGSVGEVVRSTFTVEIDPAHAHLYRAGV